MLFQRFSKKIFPHPHFIMITFDLNVFCPWWPSSEFSATIWRLRQIIITNMLKHAAKIFIALLIIRPPDARDLWWQNCEVCSSIDQSNRGKDVFEEKMFGKSLKRKLRLCRKLCQKKDDTVFHFFLISSDFQTNILVTFFFSWIQQSFLSLNILVSFGNFGGNLISCT